MKSIFRLFLLLSVLGSLGMAATGTESAEQKAALAVLDRLFGRIDELAAKIDDADYKNIVQANVDDLKARSASLRQNFDTAVFQDLKFDATIEHHRIARWLEEPELKPVPATADKSKK